MRLFHWLNPLVWFWAPVHAVRGVRISRDMGQCDDCDLGERMEGVEFEDLCLEHQERLRAAFGEGVEDHWFS